MVVVERLVRAITRVGAHGRPGLVRDRVGQGRDGAQEDGPRSSLGTRASLRGTRDDEAFGVEIVQRPLVFDLEGVELPERQVATHERRTEADLVVVRALLIEDARRSPRAVEAQVGNRQVGLPVCAREGHGTVDEGSVGRVARRVRGKLVLRGHRDGHGHARLRGNGHGVGGEGQVDPLTRPVGGVAGEEHALDVFGQGLAAERVGVGGVGHVGQLHLEAPPVRTIAQVSLGARGVHNSDHARVDRRGRGPHRVHEARANAARRIEGPVGLRRVRHRARSAHQEVGDHSVFLRRTHPREGRVGRHTLTHEGGDTRNLSRGLGRAGHAAVVVPGAGRHDGPAGGSDLGFEAQVVGRARTGEVGDADRLRPLLRHGLFIDRGHRQGRGVERGEAEQPRIRVTGVAVVLVISSRRVHDDALIVEGLVHLRVERDRVSAHPLERREGDGNRVRLQHCRVVESGQQGAVVRGVCVPPGSLRDDELCAGGRTRQGSVVGGRESRDVRALFGCPSALATRYHIRVTVAIVVGEGDLVADPCAVLASTEVCHQGRHVRLREAQRGGVHHAREGFVRGVNPRVDDLDDLSLAPLGGCRSTGHTRGRAQI